MKVGFVTFGCRLNLAEALDQEAQYAAAGWEIVPVEDPRPEPPELIIVHGCSVTAKAQRDCEKKIAHLRARFPGAEIRITGCLDVRTTPADLQPPSANRQPPLPSHHLSRAYLKVQDGCSGKCSYCIVPAFRGAPVSIPFNDVLARARAFIDDGFREIVVTGCNLCLYRDAKRGLPELVAALARLESPGHRIRIGSIEPGICDAALLDAVAAHANVCRFMHLSLQSGSDRILRLMRRTYTAEQMATFCEDARRRLGPRFALGADIITGFPGETDADHEATKSLLSPSFINLHIFPYSERPGTEAATMTPSVPVAVRRARAKELEQIGAANREKYARVLIGKDVVVCVEKDGNGRTDEYLRCNLQGTAPRRSLVCAEVKDYFPKTGALSATIHALKH